jgi:citrate synthase
MSTFIRSSEAARILGVTPATLYAYVSSGRLHRRTGADGRTSLYERDEVERLAERSRRAAPGPRPTIDVQITSAITRIDEGGVSYRSRDVSELVRTRHFEDVAEFLWSGRLPSEPTTWPAPTAADNACCAPAGTVALAPIPRLAVAALLLESAHVDDDPPTAARRLLLQAPAVLGSTRRTGTYAARLAAAWRRKPDDALVSVIDRALGLLADHELATSTLAVRIAASVRTSPYAAFAAGMTTLEGALHGSASATVHEFLEECVATSPDEVIARWRSERRYVPGFGHKVYRGVDPRFPPLMEMLGALDPTGERVAMVEHLVAAVGRLLPQQPNVDLALGAFTWIAGLEADTPLFAVARIAGWAAHFAEEWAEPPMRFRGVARPPLGV